MADELWFDVVSPYTVFALEAVRRLERDWKWTPKWRPFFLGGVMQATGNTPPALLKVG